MSFIHLVCLHLSTVEMSDTTSPENEPIRDVDWYLRVFRATQELRDRNYRTVGPFSNSLILSPRYPRPPRTRSSA